MWRQLLPAFRITLVFTVLTGLLYPAVVTGLCQALFRGQANGSLVTADGRTVGSSLIGQSFSKAEYLHPRPSAAGEGGYDGMASGGSNYGPTSGKLIDRVRASAAKFREENPEAGGPLPADLVTASGSGLDPDLSPASAALQAARIARARGVDADAVRGLISAHVEPRTLGFLGEPRVNVLAVNLALDERFPKK